MFYFIVLSDEVSNLISEVNLFDLKENISKEA